MVACNVCDLCKQNRVNDLIGRCIAEQCTASKTVAVTLTYGGDGPESAVLHYRDVQLFLKRLRKAGYKVRYIVAGEYGTKKGRAHWHIILFFYGDAPRVKIDSRIKWEYWPHGLVYFQNPDYKGFHYALKYALKQDGNDGASKALMMSKKPPLGNDFFKNMADDIVERHLPINSPEYSFAHVRDSKNRPRIYWLRGRMREIFLDRYYIMWRMLYNSEPPFSDFLLESYLDPIERKRMDADPKRIERDVQLKRVAYEKHIQSARSAEFWIEQNKKVALGFLVLSSGKKDLVVAYSDDTAVIYLGETNWQVTVGNVTVSEQLLRGGLPKTKVQPVLLWLERQWRNHRDLLLKQSLS